MAYIDIPSISVYLPIYHGTDEETLLKGVGHIAQSSLPIGGNSTHAILTGHTGLASSELFTRIDELEIDDFFYIHVLGDTLCYKIYETEIIEPDDISSLTIEQDRDLVTLVTCYPYGVNTHRLLVKAERTDYMEYEGDSILDTLSVSSNSSEFWLYIWGIIVIIIIMVIIIVWIIKNRKNNKYEEK